MKQMAMKVAGLTAGAVLMLAAQAHAVVIQVGTATGSAGSDVDVDVTLSTEEMMVAGTQNDITFPTGARIKNNEDGTPACTVNPAIMKPQTTFAFLPSGCTPGDDCTGMRSLVLAFSNTTAIADGSRLYTCTFTVDAGASGTLPLACAMPGSSSPTGGALPTTCTDGSIELGGGPTPTPTVIEADAIIHVGSNDGDPGETVDIPVTLEIPNAGTEVAGTQNDIIFSGGVGAQITIGQKEDGTPDCTVNSAINKPQTTFAFLPSGCTGEECTGVRSLVLAFSNTTAIPDGSTLYTCKVTIAETAEPNADFDLTCEMPGASTPAGGALSAACTDGSVHVNGVVVETPTATPTATTSVVETPTATPTTPSGGTATATRTPTTFVPVNPPCDDGCAVVSSSGNNQIGWMLLLPAAALIWLRRRSR